MALEDKDIFNAIFNKYSDQPIEFIMEQYEKAKILNMAIERRINAQAEQPVKVEEAAPAALPPVDEPLPVEEERSPPRPPKRSSPRPIWSSIPRKPSPTTPSPAACAARRPAP